MLSAHRLMELYAEQQGWNLDSQLKLALEYIQCIGSNVLFAQFLREQAEFENLEAEAWRCEKGIQS